MTQGSKPGPRPTTQYNPRPRTDPLEAKDRNVRGQGQGPRTQHASVFQNKDLHKFIARSLVRSPRRRKKKVMTLAHFFESKNSAVLDRKQGIFEDL